MNCLTKQIIKRNFTKAIKTHHILTHLLALVVEQNVSTVVYQQPQQNAVHHIQRNTTFSTETLIAANLLVQRASQLE